MRQKRSTEGKNGEEIQALDIFKSSAAWFKQTSSTFLQSILIRCCTLCRLSLVCACVCVRAHVRACVSEGLEEPSPLWLSVTTDKMISWMRYKSAACQPSDSSVSAIHTHTHTRKKHTHMQSFLADSLLLAHQALFSFPLRWYAHTQTHTHTQ